MVWAKLASMTTAFGQTAVRRDGPIPDRLTRTWKATQSRLPEGWTLGGLHYYASSALAKDSRSDEWVATAVGRLGRNDTTTQSMP